MTRGRGIDLTLAPSRALTQQRDYRARKKNHMQQLEDFNAQLVAENQKLNRRVEDLLHERAAAEQSAREYSDMVVDLRAALRRAEARSQPPLPHYAPLPSPLPSPQTTTVTVPASVPPFDPTCCGGLFDCSSLIGPPPTEQLGPAPPLPLPAGDSIELDETKCCWGIIECPDAPGEGDQGRGGLDARRGA
ncbi:hypothetical protein P7C73_g3119, partial [Tremellales sp. Uapishka_1]